MSDIDVYDLFEQVSAPMRPIEYVKLVTNTESAPAMIKLVQTGRCGLHDYNRGFLAIHVYVISTEHGFQIRLILKTVDDGGAAAWSQVYDSLDMAIEHVQRVIGLLKEVQVLPSLDELNITLRPFGLYMTRV